MNAGKWSHQPELVGAILDQIERGEQAILAVAPTGAGKTMILSMLAEQWLDRGGKGVVVYTNRRVIHDQIVAHFGDQGHEVGVRRAGWRPELYRRVQISSVNTDYVRCISKESWDLHDADLVLQDEAHSNTGKMAQEIHKRHLAAGARIVGVTATPLGMRGMYTTLVIGPTKSRLRKVGVLVKCLVWAPMEVDLRELKIMAGGEYDQEEFSQRLLQPVIFADVIESFRKINPEQRPSILFAPGIKESMWFRDRFRESGVTAEHLDGDTPDEERGRVFQDVRDGNVKLLTSCGVLREGFDLPIISHAILCQPTRKLRTYIQMVGRILRAAPGKDHATIQDHVAAWWRLGSPNDDYDWSLSEDSDAGMVKKRRQLIDNGKQKAPSCCPVCGQIRVPMPPHWDTCPCGYKSPRSVRKVRAKSGELVLMEDKPKAKKPERSRWERLLISSIYQGLHTRMTGGQVVMLAHKKARDEGGVFDIGSTIYEPKPNTAEWHLRARDIPQWKRFLFSAKKRRKG